MRRGRQRGRERERESSSHSTLPSRVYAQEIESKDQKPIKMYETLRQVGFTNAKAIYMETLCYFYTQLPQA